jgi:hypothetical protein
LNRAEILQPQLLAGVHIERANVRAIIDLVKAIASTTGDEKPPCQPYVVHLTCSFLISPFAVASTAVIIPISLEFKFSSL